MKITDSLEFKSSSKVSDPRGGVLLDCLQHFILHRDLNSDLIVTPSIYQALEADYTVVR